MSCRMPGPWLAMLFAVGFVLPASAQDASAPTTPVALQNELPSVGANDTDWRINGDTSAEELASERDVEMWKSLEG